MSEQHPAAGRRAGGHTGTGGEGVVVTRFAPSPSGLLHLGHAAAALFAWDRAREAGGRFLLRIEDIDTTRCRPEFEAALLEDTAWLGLEWPQPVWRQSGRLAAYLASLEQLRALGVIYPCFCTRRDIRQEVERMARAPHGPEGPLYPGTCRRLDSEEAAARVESGQSHAWRLDISAALERLGERAAGLDWVDLGGGEQRAVPDVLGDVVLARKDIGTSYHLAVVVDDAAQGVTMVTRGIDLQPATHLHRLLQELLGLPAPRWWHHALVRDDAGRRLAKSRQSPPLRELRQRGWSPEQVRDAVAEVLAAGGHA